MWKTLISLSLPVSVRPHFQASDSPSLTVSSLLMTVLMRMGLHGNCGQARRMPTCELCALGRVADVGGSLSAHASIDAAQASIKPAASFIPVACLFTVFTLGTAAVQTRPSRFLLG